MRILVTGATGTVGRALLPLLEGHELFPLSRHARISADLRTLTLDQLPPALDAVIHLAADLRYVGPWSELAATNVRATERLLGFCEQLGVKRFVYASSIEALGPTSVPLGEDAPCRPASAYGRSKLLAEQCCLAHPDLHPVVLRLGNVYAPSAPAFVGDILTSIQKGGILAGAWKGLSERNLHPLHLEDAARGLLWGLEAPEGIFHLGGPRPVSVGWLLEQFALEVPAVPRWKVLAKASLDALRRRPTLVNVLLSGSRMMDLGRIRSEGFSPRIEPEEGILATVREVSCASR